MLMKPTYTHSENATKSKTSGFPWHHHQTSSSKIIKNGLKLIQKANSLATLIWPALATCFLICNKKYMAPKTNKFFKTLPFQSLLQKPHHFKSCRVLVLLSPFPPLNHDNLTSHQIPLPQIWEKYGNGRYKLNVDGSTKNNNMGVGGVIRNDRGIWFLDSLNKLGWDPRS